MLHTFIPLEKLKDELLLKLMIESPPVIEPTMVLVGLYPDKNGTVLWGSRIYAWVTYSVSDCYFVYRNRRFEELYMDRRLTVYKERAKHYGQTVIRYQLAGFALEEHYVTSNNRVWITSGYDRELERVQPEGKTYEETIGLILKKNKRKKRLDIRIVG